MGVMGVQISGFGRQSERSERSEASGIARDERAKRAERAAQAERSERDFTGFSRPGFLWPDFHGFLASEASQPIFTGFSWPGFLRPRFSGVFTARFSGVLGERSEPTPFRGVLRPRFVRPDFHGFWRAKRANPYLRDFYGRDLRPRFSTGFWYGRLVSCHILGVFGRHGHAVACDFGWFLGHRSKAPILGVSGVLVENFCVCDDSRSRFLRFRPVY